MEKETEKNIDYEYYENGKIERTIERLEDGGIITNSYSGLGKLISTREEKENSIINKEYYRSGVLKSGESYSRVEENGEYHVYGNIKDYYSNGNLESEVTTVDSLYHGEYKKYHSNGVLEHERTYENGKGLNNFKFYKENGKLEYDHEKAENSLINKLHSFIFKRNKEKENLEEKETYIWRSYTDGASPQDLVYKEIEDRKNEIIHKGLEKEEAGLENDKIISHEKNKENKELDNIYKEYYDNGSLKLEYDNRISKEYYQDGKLKSSKEYDENLEADGTWKFYEKDGSVNRMEVYAGGELLEISQKEYGTTEIGYVHYVYNGYNEVQRKEYAPNEDEYIKVYYEDGGAKDIYHERDGMTFYTRRNENDEIVAKGTFDEEMKKVGDWVTLDKTNTPTNIKTYDEDILIKEVNYYENNQLKEKSEWKSGELISLQKYNEKGILIREMDKIRAYGNPIVRDENNCLVSKEYDEKGLATGDWKFYNEKERLEKTMLYSDGKLLEESKIEPELAKIGFVHYVYNGHEEVQRKEYAPNEDEYIKIYYEDGGAKDIYHERDGMTFYTRRNENDEIVAKGTFDEEMRKVGDWVTLDKTNTPTNIKTYDEDILIKEVNYKNGILNGPMREYDKGTGELISEKVFKGGAEEKLMETLRAAQPTQEKSQGIER